MCALLVIYRQKGYNQNKLDFFSSFFFLDSDSQAREGAIPTTQFAIPSLNGVQSAHARAAFDPCSGIRTNMKHSIFHTYVNVEEIEIM